MIDMISRQDAIDSPVKMVSEGLEWIPVYHIKELPSAELERLTDDFETIRIHLNAQKEKLCNQQRWEEAEEYQRIIDRLMAFASVESEWQLTCKNCIHLGHAYMMPCKNCKRNQMLPDWYEVKTERETK